MRRVGLWTWVWVGLAVGGCDGTGDTDTGDTDSDTADTDSGDTADTSDTSDTGDTATEEDCFDGLWNGDETDIDCGGSCAVACALGDDCSTGDDCAFGACVGLVCTAPTGGPTPTGEVTLEIPTTGGAISAVTDEHVSVTLTFPADAFPEPIEVTLRPQTPTRGWLDVEVLPAGVVFDQPVAIAVVLPPGVDAGDFGAIGMSGLGGGQGPAAPMLVPTTESTTTGATLTGAVRTFGIPGLAAEPGLRADLGYWDRLAVQARQWPPEQLIPAVEALIDDVIAEYRYDDAVGLLTVLQYVMSLQGDPAWEDEIDAFVARKEGLICTALDARITSLEAVLPECHAESKPFVDPVMTWQEMAQRFGLTDCAVATDPGDERFYLTVVKDKLDTLTVFLEDDPREYACCECEHKDAPGLQGSCVAACGARLLPTDDHWPVLLAALDDGYEGSRVAGALDQAEIATALRDDLADPHRDAIRQHAWDYCDQEGEQWVLPELADTYADPDPLLDDVQYCGSRLGLSVKNDQDEVIATREAGGTGPGAFTDSALAVAPGGGSLVLSGPVRALRCPDAAAVEADEIVVKRVAQAGTTEVASQGPNASGYLLAEDYGLDLDVDTLRQDLDPDEPIALEVWRESPACAGAYGPTETRLFTVDAVEPSMSVVSVAPHAYSQISGGLDCGLIVYPLTQTEWPFAMSTICATARGSLAADRIELSWEGPGSSAGDTAWTLVDLLFEVSLERPGTMVATMPNPECTGALFPWFFPLPDDIFSTAPGDSEIVYRGASGAVPTATWPVAAGTGRLYTQFQCQRPWSGTALSLEFTPDP